MKEWPKLYETDAEARQLARVLKAGLSVCGCVPQELRQKIINWVAWTEWHCGIDGTEEVGTPLFEEGK